MDHPDTIDFIPRGPDGAFVLALEEWGEWTSDVVDSKWLRLQERLYDAIEMVVDGRLVSKYPEARGRPVIIRVDCFGVPRQPLEKSFVRFSDSIRTRSDLHADFQGKGFVMSLDFELNRLSL